MYENLIFEGGGMKGIAYARVPEILNEKGILQNIKKVAGSSAGSIAALMISLKYPPDVIRDKMTNMSFDEFHDTTSYTFRIINLLTSVGINDGSYFTEWIQYIIRYQTANPETTFMEAFQMYGIELVITGTNVNTGKTEYFSYKTTPNMPLWIAMRISTAIPIFFTPVIYNEQVYVDGGILSNYPIWIFDNDNSYEVDLTRMDEYNPKTLGFKLESDYDIHDSNLNQYPIKSISMIFSLLYLLLNYVYDVYDVYKFTNRTVSIDVLNVTSTKFDLNSHTKKILIQNGYDATKKFLKNKEEHQAMMMRLCPDEFESDFEIDYSYESD